MRTVSAAGLSVSAIGLGTWQFGSREWAYGTAYADETAPAIVKASLDAGVTFFDTAEIYAMGRSERILGASLRAALGDAPGETLTDRRDEVVVASKLFPLAPVPPVVGRRADASARRLGLQRIDLYQLHWPNPLVPASVTMRELARLRGVGRIGHVGVSNFDLSGWQAAEVALGAPVVSNQVPYSLVDRRAERSLLPYAQSADRLVIAYSPVGQGLLSGRYDPDHVPGGVRRNNPLFLPENLAAARPLLSSLASVAAAHDATPAQVALAWLLRRPNVVVIPGASSVDQAVSNAGAAELELSDDEDAELTAASDAFTPVRGLPATRQILRRHLDGLEERIRTVQRGLRA